MKRLGILVASVLSASLLAAPAASAAPVKPATSLRVEIDRARARDGVTFDRVHEIVNGARALDRRARGGKAPIALHLRALGPKALLPMLEVVAFGAPGVTPEGRAAARLDVIEAIGLLRDPRALPTLSSMLDREREYAGARAVSEAIARLDTEDAAARLAAALATSTGERARGIAAGMGACHRATAVAALADALAKRPDAATRLAIVRSLGRAGNAWAWATLADRAEERRTRSAAAEALVAAYVASEGELREAAAKALLVVDDPGTGALLERARRGAAPEMARALDALASRLAHNPTRSGVSQ